MKFSIASLLLAVAVIAILIGWISDRARYENKIAEYDLELQQVDNGALA